MVGAVIEQGLVGGGSSSHLIFTASFSDLSILSLVYIDMGSPSASPEYAVMTMKFDADNHASFKR